MKFQHCMRLVRVSDSGQATPQTLERGLTLSLRSSLDFRKEHGSQTNHATNSSAPPLNCRFTDVTNAPQFRGKQFSELSHNSNVFNDSVFHMLCHTPQNIFCTQIFSILHCPIQPCIRLLLASSETCKAEAY